MGACSSQNLTDLERKSLKKNIKVGITAEDILVPAIYFFSDKIKK
jgi:hypothetical protein